MQPPIKKNNPKNKEYSKNNIRKVKLFLIFQLNIDISN